MANDPKCKFRKSCGYDYCLGEGSCNDFQNGKPEEPYKSCAHYIKAKSEKAKDCDEPAAFGEECIGCKFFRL